MSNAGLDESTEEVHEINVAEIKKLKVGTINSAESIAPIVTCLFIRCKSFARDSWNWA